jgi:hypothetical protein
MYHHLSTQTDPLHFVTYDIFQPSLSDTVNEEYTSEHVVTAKNDTIDNDVLGILQSLMDGWHYTSDATSTTTGTATATAVEDHQTSKHTPATMTMNNNNDNNNNTNTATMGLVVAIDINGNRHIGPILQCLQIIMNTRFTTLFQPLHNSGTSRPIPIRTSPPSLLHPRLIIVKSRSLYRYLQQQEQQQQRQQQDSREQ